MEKQGKRFFIFAVGRKGGCTEYAYNVISNFSANSYDLYLSKFYKKKVNLNNVCRIYTYKSIFAFFINSIFYLPFILIGIFYNIIRKKYSSVYFPYFHHWNIFILLLFKICGKKTIVTVHDGILHSGDGFPFDQLLSNLIIRLADKVIFLTVHVQNITKNNLNFNIESKIIPHGIINLEGIKGEIRIQKPTTKILFIGRINKYKGVENLIKAISMLNIDIYDKLTIVGKVSYSIERPDSNKIEIIDKWVDDSEFAYYINSNDILVLPYLEATQSGVVSVGIDGCIPMVCTRVGGLIEQLEENEEAIFTDTNPESLKQGIIQLIRDKSLYEKISCNLYKKKGNLTWKNISKEIQEYIL